MGYQRQQIQDDTKRWTCRNHAENCVLIQTLVGEPERKYHDDGLGGDRRMILKWIVNRTEGVN